MKIEYINFSLLILIISILFLSLGMVSANELNATNSVSYFDGSGSVNVEISLENNLSLDNLEDPAVDNNNLNMMDNVVNNDNVIGDNNINDCDSADPADFENGYNGTTIGVASDEDFIYSNGDVGSADLDQSNSMSAYANKINTVILIPSDVVDRGQNFTAVLKDQSGNNLAGREMSITITNVLGQSVTYWSTTNYEGVAKLSINLISAIWGTTCAYAGDSSYNSISKSFNLVVRDPTKTNTFLSDTGNSYQQGDIFSAILKDSSNNPISGQNIKFTITNSAGGSATYVYVTDVNGKASLVINLYPGTYNMYYCFEGSSTYNPMHGSTSFTSAINTRTTTTVNNLLGNTIFQNNNLLITLRDNNNNLLPTSSLVTIILSNGISSVNYYKYTDNLGNVYLNMTLNPYTYGITLIYEGSSTYKSAMKIFNLTVFNINQVGSSKFNSRFVFAEAFCLDLNQTYHCEVNNPVIQSLASTLTSNSANDLEKANAIFTYVRNSINYNDYGGDIRGALGTYNDKIGNCVDKTSLVVALCRSAGIPALYNFLTWYPAANSSAHAFAQILIGGTWVISDAMYAPMTLGYINWENQAYYNYVRFYQLMPS